MRIRVKMGQKLRKTGIDILGEMPWGMHVSHLYRTAADLTDILLPYFKAGLENNELCLWVTSQPLGAEAARLALKKKVKNLTAYIKKGQMEILDYTQWYTKSGKPEFHKVLLAWIEKEEEALKKGFKGLRVTGNGSWLDMDSWKDLIKYEAMVDYTIGKHRILAICSYPLGKCKASQILDVTSHHQFTLIKRASKWTRLGRAASLDL